MERIRVERLKKGDGRQECHACGKVGYYRYLIHFAHLCQHFVAVCGGCWKKLLRTLVPR